MKASYRTIIFCLTELGGKYIPNESLAVYPCTFPDAPNSKYAKHFPIVLEYQLEEYPKHFSTNTKAFMDWKERQLDISNCLTRLLSATTNHHFFKEDKIVDSGIWGIPKDGEVGIEARSIWVEEIFFWPEMGENLYNNPLMSQSEILTAPVVSVTENDSDYHYYFEGRHPEYPDKIVFPDCASNALYSYAHLDTKTQIKIDAITQLIDNGLALIGRMKSLSFLSFVAAIETLVNMTTTTAIEFCRGCGIGNCRGCGHKKYQVRSKFVDFLSNYVSDSEENKKIYRKIYDRRSKITHEGALLLGDAHQNWSKRTVSDQEFMLHKITMQIARVSLVNYLLKQGHFSQI